MTLSRTYIKDNLTLAWPLALNALLMQSMLMIDTLLVSPLGEESVAAMGVATTIVAFVLGIQMALSNGTQMILSRAFGSGRTKSLSNAFFGGLAIASCFAAVFMSLILIFGDELVALIVDSESLITKAESYLSISVFIILFTSITQTIVTLFNSTGKTSVPFKGYLIELPFNCAVSYMLIYQFDMGVSGAALGSLSAIMLRTVYLAYSVLSDDSISLPLPEELSAFIKTTRHHLGEILPFAANITILAIGITIYQLMFSQLNINEYVAITLLYPWIRTGSQFITSWSHASAILISQRIGAGKLDDLKQCVDTSIDVAVGISFISCLFFVCLHFSFGHIYPGLASETYLAMATIAPLYILLPFVRGYNTVHGNILRAVGKTKSVFKINFTGQWVVSLPLLAIIIFVLDGSIFWAFAIQPFEELIKAIPFRTLARRTVREFDLEAAKKMNYD
ncbi:MATE family efflux transporter [Vibrio algarum]|uniref:MATE family efflux transporter n=1 Tax=Vibrio algarum TaxID=3020714 RepID=A0ABT4YU48_9VIBR|nr:MATE family efflux transporter [Vibrio sp. KJ40-1]MDB1124990.1 MATE family efflux transporter [Vibrio sp. KJ40-1]